MSDPLHRLADLLLAMEQEMRRIDLWGREAPHPAALASTTPFCYDTLQFEQWLQWIFLPRMKQILEQGHPWPARSDIAPMAEHRFGALQCDSATLLRFIRQFDELINSAGAGPRS